MSLNDNTVKEFIELTASQEPVPGGGSVSALCGALALALTRMVARLTVGRKKYADVELVMQDVVDTTGPEIEELLKDVDRDSEAYAAVMAAFRLPKDTDREKAVRREAIQEATKKAAEVPLSVAQRVVDLFPYIEIVAAKGNANAVTDAAVAAMAARTAVRGALLNVRINLGSINDTDYVTATIEKMNDLEVHAANAEEHILCCVEEKL